MIENMMVDHFVKKKITLSKKNMMGVHFDKKITLSKKYDG
jgi:hypothetical protein